MRGSIRAQLAGLCGSHESLAGCVGCAAHGTRPFPRTARRQLIPVAPLGTSGAMWRYEFCILCESCDCNFK